MTKTQIAAKDEIIRCLEEDLYEFEIKIKGFLVVLAAILRDPAVSDAVRGRIRKVLKDFTSVHTAPNRRPQ